MADHEYRSFSTLVTALDDGAVHKDLTDYVRDIVAALHDVRQEQGGKPKGSITLKIDFKLEGDLIELVSDVKAKIPTRAAGKTVMWATPDNHLTPRNPKQQAFQFRDASAAPAETRDAV